MSKQPRNIFWTVIFALIGEFLPFLVSSGSFFVWRIDAEENVFEGPLPGFGTFLFLLFLTIGILSLISYSAERLNRAKKVTIIVLSFLALFTCLLILVIVAAANLRLDEMSSSSGSLFYGHCGVGLGFWLSLFATLRILYLCFALRSSKRVVNQPGIVNNEPHTEVNNNVIVSLEKLIEMKNRGQITEEEYQVLKSKIILNN
jgi:hypothetical protein